MDISNSEDEENTVRETQSEKTKRIQVYIYRDLLMRAVPVDEAEHSMAITASR